MEDVPVTAEGMLALTWTLNVLVFVLLVLRLAVHRRPGLNTTAVMTSDALVFISWLFGVASIATDAWKYNQEIQSRTRALSPEEQAIARKVVFPGIFIHHIKLNPPATTAVVYVWIFGFHRNVARERCICGLLLSSVSGSHAKIEEIPAICHHLHCYYVHNNSLDTNVLVSPNLPQLVSLTLPRSHTAPKPPT